MRHAALLREKIQCCLVDIGKPAQEELRAIAASDLSAPDGLDEYPRKEVQACQNEAEFHRLQLEHDITTPPKIRLMITLLEQARSKILGIIPRESDGQKGATTARMGLARKRLRRPQEENNLSPSERCAYTTVKPIAEQGRLKPQMTGTGGDYARLKHENEHFLSFRIAAKHPQLREKLLHLQSHRHYIRLT